MKTNLKVALSTIGIAALLAFPAMTKAKPVTIIQSPVPAAGTVTAITADPPAGTNIFTPVGHGLQIATVCHDGGNVLISFANIGDDAATINFLFSDGATTVKANGQVLAPKGLDFQAEFNSKRIEGQFIFANDAGNTTVILHAFDGGTFCETRGTVLFGPNPPPPLVFSPR